MSFLDKVLNTATETQPTKEVSLGDILDGDPSFKSDDGSIVLRGKADIVRDDDGETLANLRMDLDDANFSPRWTLKIPADKWKDIRIVCDGNSLNLDTKPLSGNRYIMKRTLRGFRPSTVVEEKELVLREFETAREFLNWIESKDTDTIEALRQIYYDRWCFDTANQRDRMYYEMLEDEKKGRT
jgi:hypothetical protein